MPKGIYTSNNRKGLFKKGHKINLKYEYDKKLSPQLAFYRRNKEVLRKKAKEKLKSQRLEAMVHYGGNPPQCKCCGESKIEFLSFDHINGGGSKHRKSGIGNISYWLVKNKFPEGFQILCHNCNQAKSYYGKCPHQN